MTATSGSKSGRGGRRPGAGRKRKDPAKPPKVPKQRGGSGRGGWRPGAGRKPGPWSAGPSRPPPNQAELFAEAFTSEPPIAASAKGPALGAYSASATEAATPGTNAPTGERERPIEFLLRISNLLEPRDGNAIREIVDRLEAGTSFEQAIGLASDGDHASVIACCALSPRADFRRGASQKACERASAANSPRSRSGSFDWTTAAPDARGRF